MSKPTKTLLGSSAREAILHGVNSIYEPVRKTLGPAGKNGLLYPKYGGNPRITNDGITVADTQEPKNQFVRLAAQSFKESCKKTNEKVGDGTTTTAIIGGKLFNDVMTKLSEQDSSLTAKSTGTVNVSVLKKEILDTATKVKESVKKIAKKIKTITDLERIATISVEDEKLGKIIASMAWDIGTDGFIDVVEGYKGEVETEVIKGMRFAAKVPHKAFVNNPARYEMVMTDSPVMVTNFNLDNVTEFSKAFQDINSKTSKLIIVAPSFSSTVLQNMANAIKQGFFIYPVKAPSLRTEQFEDLAVYCGATFVDKGKGKKLRNVSTEDLGFVDKMIVKDTEAREDAVVTGGAGERTNILKEEKPGFKSENKRTVSPIQARIKMLKGQLVETKEDQFKKLLERRIASMASAIGTIRVGGASDAAIYYQKLKIEDAVYACKAALRGGYVAGGGLALKEIADKLPKKNVLREALIAPYNQIQTSVDGGVKITEDIIDPAEVVYYAVEHATSVVANLATVDVMTVEIEDPYPEEGNFAIANMIKQLVIADKIAKGQMQENEDEARKDMLGGKTQDEFEYFNTN